MTIRTTRAGLVQAIKRAVARSESIPAFDYGDPVKTLDAMESNRANLETMIAYELGCKFVAVAWTSEDVPTGAGNLSDEETRQALAAANAHVSEGSAAMYAAFFETLGIRPDPELWTSETLGRNVGGSGRWEPQERRLCLLAANDLIARGHSGTEVINGCIDAAGLTDDDVNEHAQAEARGAR